MIVLYKGARGKGKNLSVVKDAFKFHKNGFRIISNFHISFAEFITNSEFLDMIKLFLTDVYSFKQKYFRCVFCLDELHILMDSRNFGKDTNKNISYFVAQIRKMEIHILGSTQYINTVDLRFRQQCDVLTFPDFDKNTGYCTIRYFDLSVLEDIDINMEFDISPVTVIFNANQVFPLYDTNELIS